MSKSYLDNRTYVVYNIDTVVKKEGSTMERDTFTTMLRDGNTFAGILQSVQEDKRFLLSMMAEAFINGLNTGEKLAQARQTGE